MKYGGYYPQVEVKVPSEKELGEKYSTFLKNEKYALVLENYFICISSYLNQFQIPY